MASDSSAKAGSKALRGNEGPLLAIALADSRKEERDEGRRGVVGRETLVRDVERFRSCDMILVSMVSMVVGSRKACGVILGAWRVTWAALAWVSGSDALLSRLTPGLLKLFWGRWRGSYRQPPLPSYGGPWRVPPCCRAGGVPVPGAKPASPSLPEQSRAIKLLSPPPALDQWTWHSVTLGHWEVRGATRQADFRKSSPWRALSRKLGRQLAA